MNEVFKNKILLLFFVGLISCTGEKEEMIFQKNEPVDFSKVRITDSFWQPRLKTHAEVTLSACINQCEQETNRMKNFAVAAGMEKGEFRGFVYDDSDVYKMIEGASYSLMNNPNPVLEKKLDEMIAKIEGAQLEDGYLMTYFILGNLADRWTNMDKHEMYCCGHLIEAAIAYYRATGKRALLDVAIRYADHINRTFGEGKKEWVPGHQEIELALVKLYRTTQNPAYLKLAQWLLDQRGHHKGDWKAKDYYQDLKPVRELSKISGHAVRAMYMFTGMADVAAITQDSGYRIALDRLWEDVVEKKMYLTGGIGSSRHNEGFSEDYDLPNEEAYCETCASVGMVFWNQRMNMLKGESRYEDVLERAMYNGALAGISLSGDRFFYVNPLASSGKHHRKAWYGTACCPSQISRFLPSVGNYIYALSENTVWVNLYIGSETEVEISGVTVALKQETLYPWNGNVTFYVNPRESKDFKMKLRIPAWCEKYVVKVNGQIEEGKKEKGYVVIDRLWAAGDVMELNMNMTVKVVAADPRVKANAGKRALQRGPLVYCMEETDNPGFDQLGLSSATTYTTAFEKELLGGVVTITALEGKERIKFIPYYAWDNRDAGKMKVWVDYRD